jgi:N-acetylmuramoyl-L-alanine amidase
MDIIRDFIPHGRQNRPMKNPSSSLYGKTVDLKYITIHNAYWSKDAKALHEYVKSIRAAERPAGWHFSIDEKECYQAVPLNESSWHAGDGTNGTGNRYSVGIEICDYAMLLTPRNEALYMQAEDHAAQLCAWLIDKIPSLKPYPECLRQHWHWSGKNCPSWIRARPGGWQQFIDRVGEYLTTPAPPEEPDLPVPPKPPQQTVYYRVIAGSFKDRDNADLLRKALTQQGHRAWISIYRP